jgi:hypothetical protein
VGRYGLDAYDSGQRPVAGCCEHGNGHSGSIKGGKFLDKRNECYFSIRTLLHGIS